MASVLYMNRADTAASEILKTLRMKPRGLTISDISKQIGMNRNIVAKHLEILQVSGQVDMRIIGPSKIFSLAQRVPLSAFLCFTKNLIIVIDSTLRIVQVNEQFLNLAGLKKQDMIGMSIRDGAVPVVSVPTVVALIQGTGAGQFITEVSSRTGSKEVFYQMQVIPTTFDDGEKGYTVVLEEITERKKYLKNMEFLARTAMELIDLPSETDIYQYIGNRLCELIPEASVYVNSYDEVREEFIMRAIVGMDFRENAARIVGRDLVGVVLPLREFFAAPFNMTPPAFREIHEFIFTNEPGGYEFEGRRPSLYELCMRIIPADTCERLLQELNLGKLYAIGLVWREHLFGVVGIFMPPHTTLGDRQAVESFIRQASIAISKRMTDERLRRTEQEFREVIDLAPVPTAIIERDGRYRLLNRKFTEVFGYTLHDIPTGKDWFLQAFPDLDERERAVAAWKSDLAQAGAGQIQPRVFRVCCKNGDAREILFRPVTLADGTQYITFGEIAGTE